jgi:large subunit ribosomal protein L22
MSTVETTPREVQAQAKWVRSSARKARLITDLIRGRSVPEARTILAFSSRAVARDVEKVLRSAVANAESSHQLIGDNMFISAAYADEGPTMKRWRARARGRVARVRKRTCHITVKLQSLPEAPVAPPAPKQEAAAEEAPTPKPKRKPAAKKTTTTTTRKKKAEAKA